MWIELGLAKTLHITLLKIYSYSLSQNVGLSLISLRYPSFTLLCLQNPTILPRLEPVHSLTPIWLSVVEPQRNVYWHRFKFLNILSRIDVVNLETKFMGYIWKWDRRSLGNGLWSQWNIFEQVGAWLHTADTVLSIINTHLLVGVLDL